MQFDELCALVGALRGRVAELEAKEAAREEERRNRPQIVLSERWLVDARGSEEIQDLVAKGVAQSRKASGGQVAPGVYLIGNGDRELMTPPRRCGDTVPVDFLASRDPLPCQPGDRGAGHLSGAPRDIPWPKF